MRRRSIADELRAAEREHTASLSPSERIELALDLGRRSLDLYCARSGLDRDAARRELERRAQARRRRCRCIEELIA